MPPWPAANGEDSPYQEQIHTIAGTASANVAAEPICEIQVLEGAGGAYTTGAKALVQSLTIEANGEPSTPTSLDQAASATSAQVTGSTSGLVFIRWVARRGPLAYTRLYVRDPARPGGPLGKWSLWSGSSTLCQAP